MSKFKSVVIASCGGKSGAAFREVDYIETSQDPPFSMKMDAMEFFYETYGKVTHVATHHGSCLVITPRI